jgi:hypothetical protein
MIWQRIMNVNVNVNVNADADADETQALRSLVRIDTTRCRTSPGCLRSCESTDVQTLETELFLPSTHNAERLCSRQRQRQRQRPRLRLHIFSDRC